MIPVGSVFADTFNVTCSRENSFVPVVLPLVHDLGLSEVSEGYFTSSRGGQLRIGNQLGHDHLYVSGLILQNIRHIGAMRDLLECLISVPVNVSRLDVTRDFEVPNVSRAIQII